MNSQAYIACDDMGFAMSSLENGGSYTDQEAKSFCTNECATMMHDTVSNLVAYCDLPAGDTDIVSVHSCVCTSCLSNIILEYATLKYIILVTIAIATV